MGTAMVMGMVTTRKIKRNNILLISLINQLLFYLKRDLRSISYVTFIQILIQVLGLVTGFLIIRHLSTTEYAWYTIANTLLGTMTVLSDGGVASAMMALGGRVWQNKKELGKVFSTAYDLRKRFAVISLGLAIPILFYLLQKQGASTLTSLLIIFAIIPAFFASLSDNLLQVAPKLNLAFVAVQKNNLLVAIIRFLAIPVLLFIAPFAWIILLLAGVIRIYGNQKLWPLNKKYVDETSRPDIEIRKVITRQVSRLLPGTIYYCFSGQIALWIMSLLGTNTSVAGLGALSRFSLLFSAFTMLFGSVVTPKFSKLTPTGRDLMSMFIRIHILCLFCFLFITFFFYVLSHEFLMLLGNGYQGLSTELIWSISSSLIGIFAGFSFSLFTARGWSINPLISIGVNLLALIAGILIFQVSTLKGVLMMNVFVNSIQYLMNTIFCLYKINYSKIST